MIKETLRCDECGDELDCVPVDELLCSDCHREADEEQAYLLERELDYQAGCL